MVTPRPQRPSSWLGIELRHLAALQAVADHESFVRAARSLGYTQSAISQQIAALERVVGERLIDRPGGPRRVTLTDAGRLLLEHATAIIARLATAEADMEALSRGERGVLRLGAYQSVGSRVLPVLMRRFLRHSASGDVRLTESIADPELLHLVAQGDVDLAFASCPLPEGPFASAEVLVDPFVLVADTGSPFVRRPRGREFSLADLDGEELVCFQTCRSTDAALGELAGLGIAPRIVFQSDHNSTVQGLAAAGIGAALIPRLAYDSSDPYTEVIDVGHLLPPRVIALVWHEATQLSPIAQAFVELARDACMTIARDEEQRAAVGRASPPDREAVSDARLRAFAAPGPATRLHAVDPLRSDATVRHRAARR
jgi:DNA-binding transcriptional LysR family regulator